MVYSYRCTKTLCDLTTIDSGTLLIYDSLMNSVVVYCHVTVNLQEGATALHLASENGHVTTVQLLVEAGASLDVQTNVSCYPDKPQLIVWVVMFT